MVRRYTARTVGERTDGDSSFRLLFDSRIRAIPRQSDRINPPASAHPFVAASAQPALY